MIDLEKIAPLATIDEMVDEYDMGIAAGAHPEYVVRVVVTAAIDKAGFDSNDAYLFIEWKDALTHKLFRRDVANRPDDWWSEIEAEYRAKGWKIVSWSTRDGLLTLYCAYQGDAPPSPAGDAKWQERNWHDKEKDCWLWLWVNDGNWKLPQSNR